MAAAGYGGQAVMEGVMIRGPGGMAVAVRTDGGTTVDTLRLPLPALATRPWRWPVLRGLAALGDGLALGMRALLYSAEIAAAPAGEPAGARPTVASAGGTLGFTVFLSGALALGLFILLPAFLAGRLRPHLPSAFVTGLVEGLIRLGLLIGYVLALGLAPEMRRVLQFHGAEHKAIAALEAGLPLQASVAARCSRFHPRCGTSFLFFVVLLTGLAFSLLPWQSLVVRLAVRIALLPLLAGLGYELLRLSARGAALGRWGAAPGLWLQRLTTREPDHAQLEVALAALRAALELSGDPA